jgi:3D (Asp-Asp-Asp) domain-containing protein
VVRKILTVVLVIAVIILTKTVGVLKQELADTNNRLAELETEDDDQYEQLLEKFEKLQKDRGRLEDELNKLKQRVEEFEIFEFEATGYSPFDDRTGLNHDGSPDTTATGTRPRPGVVAVNPKIIPYGTIMYIEGYGWGIAEDTGEAIRRRTDLIDLFFYTHDEAYAWGRRTVKVLFRKGEVNRANNS